MGAARQGGATSNTISGGIFFHAVIQGRDITVQLPPAIDPALAGLPKPASAFTGRGQHVERLLANLAPATGGGGEQRTVLVSAVSGLAGIGKTELVIQTASQALRQPGWFPGGVLFVDLFGYDPERSLSPERALEGLLRALAVPGEHIPGGLEDRQRLYRSVLAAYAREGRRILVVVDNASTTGQASPLLPTDGINAALVTSRHTLDGLDARLHDLDILDTEASTAVLDQALRHARGNDDTRFTDDADAATVIARLCAGLPLALRIAAALLAAAPARPASSLAAALQAEHTRLDKLARPDRAVRAAFDLSYQHLTPDQARIFRLLPLNPGPDLATDATAHLGNTGPDQAEELLQQLAEAHLIEPGSSWGRWRMHDLVRLYADDHGRTHATPDQRDSARTRLFTHYQDCAQAADTHLRELPGPRALRFPDPAAALRWLDGEHANLTATATAAPALGHPNITTSLASTLVQYLRYRRYFDDLITLSTAALTVCREAGNRHGEGGALNNLGIALREVRRFEEAIDAHTQAITICRELGDRSGASTRLTNLGIALREVRRFEEAIDAHTQATTICRELGDHYGEGIALHNLGGALQQVRRFEEAVDALAQATTIYRQSGDQHGENKALYTLGGALLQMRRFEEAIDTLTQATTICRELGDRHGEGQALNNLGIALQRVRRFEEAINTLTQATTIYRDTSDRHGEGQALNNLGITLQEVRRFEEAINTLTQATTIYRDTSDRHGEGQALDHLGIALREVRRFEEAIDAHTRAIAIYRDAGDRHGEGSALNNLGGVLQRLGRFEEAINAHSLASTICRELDDHHGEGIALSNLGGALQQVRRFEEAVDALTQATTNFREVGDRHGGGGALNNLGLALRQMGRFQEAIDALTQATTIYRDTGDHHGEGQALYNLGIALREMRRFEEAIDALAQATTIYRELGDRHSEGQALYDLGNALQEAWRFEEAVDAHTRATTIFRELGGRNGDSQARMV
ncbi:tetratricopeptide repeat protein [Streptomyces erythrochromogenes]|uniref:tetratricopeptide repeat protein n=1 Tax=Streptomyces erythrochromogenes TaxID=285574 RepID=UPI00386B0010|nr:tetratricopeptide repeat protein [Streptomyces erythrochromogenes]WST99026.1 tetratricopeptide repeat protein [Streptomyces erythrochromogenes]